MRKRGLVVERGLTGDCLGVGHMVNGMAQGLRGGGGGGGDCLSCFAADNHGRWTVNHDVTLSKLPHRTDIYGTIY